MNLGQEMSLETVFALIIGINWSSAKVFYAGNFWAALCSHIRSFDACHTEVVHGLENPRDHVKLFGVAEEWIGHLPSPRKLKFVSLRQNKHGGLYRRLISPRDYSDHSYRWLDLDSQSCVAESYRT